MSNFPPPQNYGQPFPPQGQPPYGGQPQYPNQPPSGMYPQQPATQSNGSAIASLVFGLLGCVPFLTGLLAIVFGFLGIRRARTANSGKGLAIAGLVLGVLSVVGWSLAGGFGGILYLTTQANRDLAGKYIKALDGATAPVKADDGSFDITQQDIDAFKAEKKSGGSVSDVTTLVTAVQNDSADLTGLVKFSGGEPRAFLMRQVKENGQWKAKSVKLVDEREARQAK